MRPPLGLAVDNDSARGPRRRASGVRVPKGGGRSFHAESVEPHRRGARLIEVQEESARRIAQSLHDEASQMLAIVYLELANIARNSPAPTARRIDRVISHLDSVCEQIRGLSHELHPMMLEQKGLWPALRQLARGVSRRSGLKVRLVGEAKDLPAPVEAAIYRVVQEALSNVVRHAAASEAEVRLWQTEDRIFCSVSDDGVGCPLTEKQDGEDGEMGLGLVGIFERVDALGGECHIHSGGRKGTELTMGIPL